MTSALVKRLAAESVELCAKLAAKDLAGLPVYVLPLSSIDAQPMTPACGAIAWTGFALDLELKEQIPDWRGRGFCCVINDADDALLLSERDRAVHTRWHGAAVHELAHAVTWDREWFTGGRELRHRIRARLNERARLKQQAPDPTLPWADGHDNAWIRSAIHLCYRARLLGVPLDGELCGVAGPNYGLSVPARYAEALGAEPFAMEDFSIRQVLETRPPAAFEALWQNDVRKG